MDIKAIYSMYNCHNHESGRHDYLWKPKSVYVPHCTASENAIVVLYIVDVYCILDNDRTNISIYFNKKE